MDGGSVIGKLLKAHGVKFVFTLCGGHISPILVGSKQQGIRVIDVRHEANAVFAADAVARLTGIPGVAAVTAGPGVTNTITAIKNAQLAQSPLVLLGGATATVLRGRGSLQDIDQMALIKPHVKWAARPNNMSEVVPALEKAFRIAVEGVPGPVFVELAVDLLYDESIVRDWYKSKTEGAPRSVGDFLVKNYLKLHLHRVFRKKPVDYTDIPQKPKPMLPTKDMIQKAKHMFLQAQKPVFVIGSQATYHPNEITDLVEAIESLEAPVFLSGMARGLLGKDHPLQMRHKRRNALKEADLVLLCGVPCDFRLDYGSHISSRAKLISANRSKEDATKNRTPDLIALSDPHLFLVELAQQVKKEVATSVGRKKDTSWLAKLRERHQQRQDEIEQMAEEKVEFANPLKVCQGLEETLSEDSILVADGGDFVATASYLVQPRKPLSWLDPGVFGTLGVGAGFALGAKLCRPSSDVWLIYGDGSAGYSIMEYDTFVRHGIPVISVVGNDAGWTQIARDQVVILKDDVATTLLHSDYDKIAEGWGAKGIRVDSNEQVEDAMKEAVQLSRAGHPVLINALIGKTDFRKGSISM